jgi:hypothetical protein
MPQKGQNDLASPVVDVVGVDAACTTGWSSSAFRSRRTTAAKHRTTKSDYWNLREIFENGEIDIDELDDKLAAQLGSIEWRVDSPAAPSRLTMDGDRSNRRAVTDLPGPRVMSHPCAVRSGPAVTPAASRHRDRFRAGQQ